MLQHLIIKNYALIQHLELSPDASLNIITGETGAGKSIILGAIGLLLGNRADAKSLYNETEKCSIEGHFAIENLQIQHLFDQEDLDYEPVCIIRREISPQGKSRAFINDSPVTLDSLKKIGDALIEIHSQHETLALASDEYQLGVIDSFAQNTSHKSNYSLSYQNYLQKKKLLNDLQNKAADFKKDFDYNNFLYQELKQAKIKEGQLEQLEQQLKVLENTEDIKTRLEAITEYLYNTENSAIDYLEQALVHSNSLGKYGDDYLQFKDRIHSSILELKDLYREAEIAKKGLDVDEASLAKNQQKIDVIHNLLQKHHVKTEADLLAIQQSLATKVETILHLDTDLEAAHTALEQAQKQMAKDAEQLSKSRAAVLPKLAQQMQDLLAALGMPNAQIKLEHTTTAANALGQDQILIKFSANKGIAPQLLRSVASGGEFSRLMLALKYLLASKRKLPTIIFDEIDSGVSGEISIKVGKMMREMAQHHQIIAITHLHQIAAQGVQHYFVYKDHSALKTSSNIRLLSTEERVQEIAQMIGGAQPSSGIIANAREILEGYR